MSIFNVSTLVVNNIRFVKVGRFCFTFCISKEYRPLPVR